MSKKSNLLMVRTKDRRKFFTYQKNLPMLVEFAKTFGAELSVISTIDEEAEVLDLSDLAPAICDSSYNTKAKYEVISKIYPKEGNERLRRELLENAMKIRKYIRTRLAANKAVSLKELKQKFGELGLTDSCLCNHLSQIRKEIEDSGTPVTKLGAGTYIVQVKGE